MFIFWLDPLIVFCRWRISATNQLRLQWSFQHVHLSFSVCLLIFTSPAQSIFAPFLSQRSEVFSRKDTPSRFRFFPVRDIPLRFISAFKIEISQRLLVELVCFLDKHYDRFMIHQIPIYRPPIFFGLLLAKKMSDFSESKAYIFEHGLYSKLADADVFALIDGIPFPWAVDVVFFCQKLSATFCQNKWNFFLKHLSYRLSTAFVNLDTIFSRRIGSIWLVIA